MLGRARHELHASRQGVLRATAPSIQTVTTDGTDPNRISGIRAEVRGDFIRC